MVVRALQNHPTLRGNFEYRDPRYTTRAIDQAGHQGYSSFFRSVDAEAVAWIQDPKNVAATPEQFLSWLRSRYSQPDLKAIFPNGF